MRETETLPWRIFHETFYVMTTPAYLHMVIEDTKVEVETDIWSMPSAVEPSNGKIGYEIVGGVGREAIMAWASPVYRDESNPKQMVEYQLPISTIADVLWRDGPIQVRGDTTKRMLELLRQYTGELKLQGDSVHGKNPAAEDLPVLLKLEESLEDFLTLLGVTSTYTNLPSSIRNRAKINSIIGLSGRRNAAKQAVYEEPKQLLYSSIGDF